MVGGVSDGDINDEGAKKALNFAVDQHNSRTNDMYLRQVAEVVKVQKQVGKTFFFFFFCNRIKAKKKKNFSMEF